MNYRWDFATVAENWMVLLAGLQGTLKIFLVTMVLGMAGGLVVGVCRCSRDRRINWPSAVFVEFFRNTPVLVQIMWFFFALPILLPVDVGAFAAAVLGISLNTAAFSAEIFRGGIQSLDPGQWDGARALGMRGTQMMRRVILPQAIKRMLPPLTNRGVEVFKMSTLASVVAYAETLHQGKTIALENFNPIEVYTVVALLFFALLYPMVRLTYRLERELGRSD